MKYLSVKENYVCIIFSSNAGKKDLQTRVCVCVCTDLYADKQRKGEGRGRRESQIYRENDIEKRAQILTLGESGCRVHRNSLNYLEVLLYV